MDFQKHKAYRKLHIICGTNTGIISEARISKGTASDSPFLPELVKETAKRFDIRRVCADAGYLSRENAQCIADVQAKPFIMPKSNVSGACKGHYPAWGKMIHMWREKPELFSKQYHMRSRVESVFSNMKTTLLDGISSKKETSQMNELLIRVICHNLMVIIGAIFSLGISPFLDD
jgi:hypothetical protein